MEIGITGGEEDGVDNSNADNASLYTQPPDIYDIYKALSAISPNFSIAAGFGNVHGVYKPGNVALRPELLGDHQKYTAEQIGEKDTKPLCVLLLALLSIVHRFVLHTPFSSPPPFFISTRQPTLQIPPPATLYRQCPSLLP